MWNKTAEQELIRILQEMIRIDSSNPPGNERNVAEYIQKTLGENNITSSLYEKRPGRSNIVAVVEGVEDAHPILLISHMDVVPVKQEEWSFDGFGGHIRDGFLQGRGTIDTKQLTAMELIALLLIVRAKKPLKRSIIFIATADEENSSTYGMEYLSEEHPELLRDSWVLNEGGGFIVNQKESRYRLCTCGEKGKFSVRITMKRTDVKGNTISGGLLMKQINDLLHQLSAYESPEIITEVMESFRQTIKENEYSDQTIRNLWEYGIRNDMQIVNFEFDAASLDAVISSVPTEDLELKVDFKTIPGVDEVACRELFSSLIADAPVSWEVISFTRGYLSEVDSSFALALKEVSEQLDPGALFLPMIALGNTDGRYIAENVYGFSPMLEDMPFSKILTMIHNKDEKISLPSLAYGGRVIYEVLYRLTIDDSDISAGSQ